ncbi:hypothetical protein SO694_0016307 [Aureococcus anophagefferens]|uniref:Dolichyl-diphosphooligosaccharide--protein glycotransferase n=1 Tax=Aureococcus anophagefferens TaxID=44056 RepID=A0ABR1G5A6_AURAN
MAASWGGYVFVGNMVAVHAFALVLLGRFGDRLHRAYSLFSSPSAPSSDARPVIGMTPLRSLEQIAPLLLVFGLQLLAATELVVKAKRAKAELSRADAWKTRLAIYAAVARRARRPAYWHYLHYTAYGAPVGLVVVLVAGAFDAKTFIALYAVAAYFFANKMVRLIIFLGPVASALTGVFLGATVDWTAPLLLEALLGAPETAKKAKVDDKKAKKSKGKKADDDDALSRRFRRVQGRREPLVASGKAPKFRVARTVLAAAALAAAVHYYKQFSDYAWSLAEGMSQPSIMRCLTSPEKSAHKIVRHLADYVLIWTGGGGDDLAKSPHMARIGNSVYRDICPDDPACGPSGFSTARARRRR